MTARRTNTSLDVPLLSVDSTVVEYDGKAYRLTDRDGSARVTGGDNDISIGAYARLGPSGLRVRLTPGARSYTDAQAAAGAQFRDEELVAAVIVAAVGGHADAERDRAGTQLSAIWSHHLAIVRGADPRLVTRTYAPSETRTIAWRIQRMAALGIRIGPADSSPYRG